MLVRLSNAEAAGGCCSWQIHSLQPSTFLMKACLGVCVEQLGYDAQQQVVVIDAT